MSLNYFRVRGWLSGAMFALLTACVSPATAPSPLAEIPSVLTVPQDLSIEVNEIQGDGAASGMKAGALAKAQAVRSSDIRNAIQVAVGLINEANGFLNLSLSFVNQKDIPVEVSVFQFRHNFEFDGVPIEVIFDFRPFDLDGDGAVEVCSGCTCPLGCAPALADCPAEAAENQLLPICFRAWLNGERFMAGVFDRVPTRDNPQSGRFRVQFPSFGDLEGTNMAILYDHSDPEALSTDLGAFLKDDDVDPENFFARRRDIVAQIGPASQAKKTPRFSAENFDRDGALFRFQAQYFSHLDFIALESIPDGDFEAGLGLVDITPPLCAQISSADPVAQVLCEDLGLVLTAGDFPPLPELSDVSLPEPAQFPLTPPVF